MTTRDPTPPAPAGLTRRAFVEQAATLGLAATIVPRAVLGGAGYVPPSRRLNVAMIGGGGSSPLMTRWRNSTPARLRRWAWTMAGSVHEKVRVLFIGC